MEVSLKLRERDRLNSILQKNHTALAKVTEKLRACSTVLEKEGSDLKKLESLSLTGLFHTILGSKEEQLDKERQEFLAAKLRYDETHKAVNDLNDDISKQIRNLAAYEGIEEQYKKVMREKENYILENKDENAIKLMDLSEELARLKSSAKELEEAIYAGSLVNEKLKYMISSLESAGNWGTWDMLGGGFLATAVKHSRIDEAGHYASGVQQLLREFRHELEDVNTYVDLDVNIGSFETFADYFFDGLISDWIVQSRINDSLSNAFGMKENIDSIMVELYRKLNEVQKKNIIIEKERKHIIEEV
jgi:hypothetical protein